MADIRKRMHFTPALDIDLLKEVMARNPWASKTGWSELSNRMRRLPEFSTVESKSIRDRINLLIVKFRKEDMLNLRKSGTEEEYTEREALLLKVSDLEAEHYRPRKRPIHHASTQRNKAAKIAARNTPLIPVMEKSEVTPHLHTPPGSLRPDSPTGPSSLGLSYRPEITSPSSGPSSPGPSDSQLSDLPPTPSQLLETPASIRSEESSATIRGHGSQSSLLASYIDLRSTIGMEDKKFRERELLLKQQELSLRREEFELHRQQVLHEQEQSKRRLEIEEREKASVQNMMTRQMSLMESVIKMLDKH